MGDVIYHEPYYTKAGCKVQQRDTIKRDGTVKSTEIKLSVPLEQHAQPITLEELQRSIREGRYDYGQDAG